MALQHFFLRMQEGHSALVVIRLWHRRWRLDEMILQSREHFLPADCELKLLELG